jgi:prephenate dehydratase
VTPEVRHTPRLGFLGPRGTFTEQALSTQADLTDMDLVTMPTMPDVLIAVDDNALDLGFVAIENAIEGTVNVTIDTLAFDVDLVIQREVVIPVEMCLLVKPGTRLDQIREIVSFGHASAQCRRWLRANLASGIEDHPENSTRFVVVSKGVIPPPSGHDKTTVVVYQRADKPGSLLAILQEFAARSINLTLLLSRPTKRSLGEYCFVLDLEGHIADPVIGDCLRTLHATQGGIKFLGSYPAGTKGSEHRRQESADAVTQADEWLSGLRERIA